MRTGEKKRGVVGLFQPRLPGEVAPSLSVRPMQINQRGATEYLISLYCSTAVLTEDALGILDGVFVGNYVTCPRSAREWRAIPGAISSAHGVGAIPRPFRVTSGSPRRSGRRASPLLTADGVTWSLSAARDVAFRQDGVEHEHQIETDSGNAHAR